MIAIGVIAVLIINFTKTTNSIDVEKFSVYLEFSSVFVNETENTILIGVYRSPGEGNISGVAIVIEYNSGLSDTFRIPIELNELESKNVNVTYDSSKGNLTKLSLAPIIDKDGVKIIGFITDEFDFGKGASGTGGGNDDDGELLACNNGADDDGDGRIDFISSLNDYGCDDEFDNDEKGNWEFTRPKRLIHFQLVGGSAKLPDRGNINPNVWNDTDGWNVVLKNHIEPVRVELGDDAFDLVMWQIGGGWSKYAVWLPGNGTSESTSYSGFLFEALPIGESNISSSITDYSVLRDYVNAHGMKMMTYIGMPRCQPNHNDSNTFIPVFEHCYPENFEYYQGELMDGSFIGIGYDYSGGHTSEDSDALQTNYAIMKDLGVEPYTEAVPDRNHPWMLGFSVWADENRWNFTEGDIYNRYYKEREINDAGGITIHGVRQPPNGTCWDETYEDAVCINQWRWDNSVRLLRQNKYISINLKNLLDADYDVSCLAELARNNNTNYC